MSKDVAFPLWTLIFFVTENTALSKWQTISRRFPEKNKGNDNDLLFAYNAYKAET